MEFDVSVRPVIFLYHSGKIPQEVIQSVLYGLEEEQIPHCLEQKLFPSATAAAYAAASQSSLGVGLGCGDNEIVLHYKNLPPAVPYQMIELVRTCPMEVLKKFGGNAARLVKGIPFKNIDSFEVKK